MPNCCWYDCKRFWLCANPPRTKIPGLPGTVTYGGDGVNRLGAVVPTRPAIDWTLDTTGRIVSLDSCLGVLEASTPCAARLFWLLRAWLCCCCCCLIICSACLRNNAVRFASMLLRASSSACCLSRRKLRSSSTLSQYWRISHRSRSSCWTEDRETVIWKRLFCCCFVSHWIIAKRAETVHSKLVGKELGSFSLTIYCFQCATEKLKNISFFNAFS